MTTLILRSRVCYLKIVGGVVVVCMYGSVFLIYFLFAGFIGGG